MFLHSELSEISQRFQSDIDDLRVLLQEEGLRLESSDSLQQLCTRLHSDSRFRRDVALLVRWILGSRREGPTPAEPIPAELGSMEVLGILVIAAAGTRQEFESPAQRELLRELLRFVIQQRRSSPASTGTSAPASALEPRPCTPDTRSLPFTAAAEVPLPTPLVLAHKPLTPPSLLAAEKEASPRYTPIAWIVAVLAVLIVLGTGLIVRSRASKPATQQVIALPSAPSPGMPNHPAALEPQDGAVIESPLPQSQSFRRPSPSHPDTTPVPTEPTQTFASIIPPHTLDNSEPPKIALQFHPPMTPNIVLPALPRQQSAAASVPRAVAPQRTTSAPTDISSVFAHPEAAAAAASIEAPNPTFQRKDPVLIARNKPPVSPSVAPGLQGTVHTGSAGNMASSLMYSPEPEYPPAAIAARVSGQVTVRAVVGPRGNVVDAQVVSGPPALREAALDAIARWRYRPFEQDGKAVAIATTAIFDFQIPPAR